MIGLGNGGGKEILTEATVPPTTSPAVATTMLQAQVDTRHLLPLQSRNSNKLRLRMHQLLLRAPELHHQFSRRPLTQPTRGIPLELVLRRVITSHPILRQGPMRALTQPLEDMKVHHTGSLRLTSLRGIHLRCIRTTLRYIRTQVIHLPPLMPTVILPQIPTWPPLQVTRLLINHGTPEMNTGPTWVPMVLLRRPLLR